MSRLAWMGALLLLVATTTTAQERDYFDLRRVTPISGDPVRGESRSELCAACHGPAGISIVPMYPHIAGQRADYLYWQLVEYRHADPATTVMAAPVAELTDQDMRDLAVYYAGLPATGPRADADDGADADASAPGPDPGLLARGEQLYLHGDPAAGIPPCQGCHGADARGHPLATAADAAGYTPYVVYPALRGQRQAYLATRLAGYRQGEAADLTSDFVMTGAAKHLDEASIEALSTWLSSLPR